MINPTIVAFCKTNLALLEGTKVLYAIATEVARDQPTIKVRCIRCLTKCHACGTCVYVKLGHDILADPPQSDFRALLIEKASEVECKKPAEPT